MRRIPVLAVLFGTGLLMPLSAHDAQATPPPYRVACQLAGGSAAFPDLVLTNTGNKALPAGQPIDVAFTSGIRFALSLPRALAPGSYLETMLPDTVNGVPTGMCVGQLRN